MIAATTIPPPLTC